MRCFLLAVLACCAVQARAAEPVQPLLLPEVDLVKRLDPAAEWVLIPLADYRAFVARDRRPDDAVVEPKAWVERATARGRLTEEGTIHWQVTCLVQATGPALSTLMPRMPERVGSVTIAPLPTDATDVTDGDAGVTVGALCVREDDSLRVAVPSAGRWQVSLSWVDRLAWTDDRSALVGSPSPLAAGSIDAALRVPTGQLVGSGVLALAQDIFRIRLDGTTRLRWTGGSAQPEAARRAWFTAAQAVHISVRDGDARDLAFSYQLDLTRDGSSLPRPVRVRLPDGWLVESFPAGSVSLDADGSLVLEAGLSQATVTGSLAATARVDLPAVEGALWSGGNIVLDCAETHRWQAPSSWWVLDANRYAAAGPGAPVILERVRAADIVSARAATTVAFTTGGIRAKQVLQLTSARRRFAVDLEIPPGIELESMEIGAGKGSTLLQEFDLQDQRLRLPLRAGWGGSDPDLRISLVYRVLLADDGFVPVHVPDSAAQLHRLGIEVAPALAVTIQAETPWRPDLAASVVANRRDLLSPGLPEPVWLAVGPRRVQAELDLVHYHAPVLSSDEVAAWSRLDLRLSVHDGEIRSLPVQLPFADPAAVRIEGEGVSLEHDESTGSALVFERGWHGTRLLRLQGPVAAGTLARLRVGDASMDVADRQWLAVQVPDAYDLEVAAGAEWQLEEQEALPSWSRAFPGLVLMRAWRLGPAAGDGSVQLSRPHLAATPDGFVDDLRISAQVGADEILSQLRCRVAAPASQVLSIDIGDQDLVSVEVDGRVAPVRQDGGRLLIGLPGRTQSDLVLVLRHRRSDRGDWDLRIDPPHFVGLPVVRSHWELGVDERWLPEAGLRPGAVALRLVDGAPARRGFGGLWKLARASVVGRPLTVSTPLQQVDPRRLGQGDDTSGSSNPSDGPADAPGLALSGLRYVGSGPGSLRVELALRDVDRLRYQDRLALVLALLAAVVMVVHLRSLAGLAIAITLMAVGRGLWPGQPGLVVGITDVLPLMLAGLWLLRSAAAGLWRWRHGPAVPALLMAIAVFAAMPAASAVEPVLGSHDGLDEQGLPVRPRIAVTVAQREAWHRRANPEQAPEAPALWYGAPRLTLAYDPQGDRIAGELRLVLSVRGEAWQELRLADGQHCTFGALDFTAEPTAAQTASSGVPHLVVERGQLILRCPPGAHGEVRLPFEGRGRGHLPGGGPLGGTVSVRVPDGYVFELAGVSYLPDELHQVEAVLAAGAANPFVIRRPGPEPTTPVGSGFDLDQQVRLALERDHLSWNGTLALTASQRVDRFHLQVPAGLRVLTVTGVGLVDWRHSPGDALTLVAASARDRLTVRVAAAIPPGFSTESGHEILFASGTEGRSRGRLALATSPWGRLTLKGGGQGDGLRRVAAGNGEAQAFTWSADIRPPLLQVERAMPELRAEQVAALAIGPDEEHLQIRLDLQGNERRDLVRLALPEPWRLADDRSGQARIVGAGPERRLEVRAGAQPFADGGQLALTLVAPRTDLASDALELPDFASADIAIASREWLIADRGTARLELLDQAHRNPAAFRRLERRWSGMTLPPGSTWRLALRHRGAEPIVLQWGQATRRIAAQLSHYLVMRESALRWSLRLQAVVSVGAVRRLSVALPDGARVRSVRGPALGSWQVDAGVLQLVGTAAVEGRFDVAVELDLPLAEHLEVQAPLVTLADGSRIRARHSVALVEDEIGVVRVSAQDLDVAVLDDDYLRSLPSGVDAAQLSHRWRGQGNWSIGIRRERVEQLGGADGLATMVDAHLHLRADGLLRGRAQWFVINRSRQYLAVSLPDGAELWQARVRGQLVRPRVDGGGQTVLPVPVLLPGETTIPVELVWQQAMDPDGRLAVATPVLADISVMKAVVTLSVDDGYAFQPADGPMRLSDESGLNRLRSQRVIDELTRLRKQGTDLSDTGLQRLEGNFESLRQELADYNAQLEQVIDIPGNRVQLQTNGDFIGQLGLAKKEVKTNLSFRNQRRKDLQVDNWRNDYQVETEPVQAPTNYAAQLANPVRFKQAERLASTASLGAGQAPAGIRNVVTTRLLGIDLMAGDAGHRMRFQGNGNDVVITGHLTATTPGHLHWPWLLTALLAAFATLVIYRYRG